MITNELYKYTNYRPQIPCIINTFIHEYDLQKANISVLREMDVIDDELYQRLYYANRMERQITIGMMEKNTKGLSKQKSDGILEMRKRLFDLNNIQANEVLTIKNDAVFIIGRELQNTQVGAFCKFIKKNSYTIFLNFDIPYNRLEIYFSDHMDGDLWNVNLDVKGIGNEALESHSNGFAQLISDICYLLETGENAMCLQILMQLYDKYINREADLQYYREFNYRSKFHIKTSFSNYYLDYVSEDMRGILDIECNLLVLRNLIQIVSNVLTSNQR